MIVRLRNIQSGAVVSCSDETAARMGGGWEPVESAEKTAPAKKTASRRPSQAKEE